MSKQKIEPLPHSWDFEHWPTHVYPHSSGRARYLWRTHSAEFKDQGIVARVGREIVVIGARYARWLELHTADVPGYQIAPNRAPPPNMAA